MTTPMTKASVYNLLFEAPIDVLMRKSGPDANRAEAEEIEKKFILLKKYIHDAGIANYANLNHAKITVDSVELAIKNKLEIAEIKWLTKQIIKNPKLTFKNVAEDYIPLLKTYMKNRQVLGRIADFRDIGDLSKKVEGLSGEIEHSATEQEKDIFYRENGWLLAMPHTTAASCELGSGTTWCTARTKSQNLFLSYVGRGENIILFYVIKEGGDPRANPWDKLSVGFINGEPNWNQGHGGVTVNANNDSLTQEQFVELLGDATAARFIQKMEERARGLEGSHPAKKEIEMYAVNEKLLQRKLATFKNNEEMIDFVHLVMDQTNISDGVFWLLAGNPDEEVREVVAQNDKVPFKVAEKLIDDPSGMVRNSLRNSSTVKQSDELSNKIYALNNKLDNDIHRIAYEYSQNGTVNFEALLSSNHEEYEDFIVRNVTDVRLPDWVAERLSNSVSTKVRTNLAERLDISPAIQLKLANDPKKQVRTNLLHSTLGLSKEILKQLIVNGVDDMQMLIRQENMDGELLDLLVGHTTDTDIIEKISDDRKTMPQTLKKIAALGSNYYSSLINNDNTPAETLELIYNNSPDMPERYITSLVERTNIPASVLTTIYNKLKAEKPDSYAIKVIAGNKNAPPEVLQDIYNVAQTDRNKIQTYRFLAQNPSTPVGILNDLSDHGEYHAMLVQNPALPASLVEKIFSSNSSNEKTQLDSLAHSNLPEQFLVKVALDPNRSASIRGEALKNRNISYEALKPFLAPDSQLRASALANPNIPGDVLTQFAQTGKKDEAMEVASNPSLPKDTMMALAQTNGLVQLALLNNPSIDKDVLNVLVKNSKMNIVSSEARRLLNNLRESKLSVKLYNILYR